MPLSKRSENNLVFILLTTALLIGALGCQSPLSDDASPADDTPVAGTPTAQPATPKPLSTAADSIPSNPEPTVMTLSIWMVEEFSPQTDLVAQQLNAFEEANPNTRIDMFLKNDTGPASTLNYLTSAKEVAPSILPDIVILKANQIPQAWRAGLIEPLDGKLDRTIIQDLIPAAQNLGTIDDRLAAIPFQLDIEHLVYNTEQITTTPILWTDVLSSGVKYQFPAKSQTGLLNNASTIHYLSTGAQLTDEAGFAIIDETALRDMLDFYQTALDLGIIDPQILNASQPEEQWDSYLSGYAGMTHISAHRYLSEQRLLNNAQASVIPSHNGNAVSIPDGWFFALVTKDPTRQNQALALIESLMQTEVNAAWATQSSVIPTRQSAFDLVAGDDPYWAFLQDYLQAGTPPLSQYNFDNVSRILQQAVEQVISGEATPEEATQTALDSLQE